MKILLAAVTIAIAAPGIAQAKTVLTKDQAYKKARACLLKHGAGFVGKCFDLLADYGKCDQALLAIDAARFGIKA